jgi:ABC-type dipeptide/oligopeptide/nickel transport systems, permease components
MGIDSLATINFDSEVKTGRRPFDAWLAPAAVSGAALSARHDRPCHHGDVRLDGDLGRPDLPLRPLSVDSAHRLAAPDALHWMGTDSFGRDVWSRIVHGARSRWPSASGPPCWDRRSASSSARLGLSLGLGRSGVPAHHRYSAGLALAGAGAGDDGGARAVAAERDHRHRIPLIPTVARVIRANTLALRELPFVEAAKSIGMSETRSRFATCCPTRWRR